MQNIHPLFIHFPIALLSVGLLFDIVGSAFKNDSLRNSGWWCQVSGIVAIIGATITGLLAESTVGHGDASHSIMETHKILELIAVGIFALLFIWRSIRKTHLPQTLPLLIVYFVVGASAVSIMFFGSHLGGRLVYEFGVGGSAVQQPEDVEHQHNHGEVTEDEAEHNHEKHEHDITDEISPALDDTTKQQKKDVHIHNDGKIHEH